MAHFVVTQAPGTWITGYVVPVADWQSLDAKVFAAINGDDGSTHAPTTAITISGAGGSGLSVTAPVVVTGAGCPVGTPGTLTTTSTALLTLNDAADFQDLLAGHAGQSRVIVTGLAATPAAAPFAFALPGATLASLTYPTIPLYRNRAYMAAQLLAPSFLIASDTIANEILCPLRVHHGATLSSVTITFRVNRPHANVPTTMPKARVLRFDASGGVTILTTSSDGSGFISSPTPASGAAWYANGAMQTLTLPTTSAIDASQYVYFVDIFDEAGSTSWPLAATMLAACRATVLDPAYVLSGVAVAVDGYTVVVGDRMLVVQGLVTDGIYLAAAGAWTRAVDMPATTTVLAGTFVAITRGLQYAGQVFQLTTGPWTVNAQPLPFMLGGQPTGNLWIAAAATHTGITSTQFQ
jgi:hypothetical protein